MDSTLMPATRNIAFPGEQKCRAVQGITRTHDLARSGVLQSAALRYARLQVCVTDRARRFESHPLWRSFADAVPAKSPGRLFGLSLQSHQLDAFVLAEIARVLLIGRIVPVLMHAKALGQHRAILLRIVLRPRRWIVD
jgi:hypothetical protein